MVKINGVDPARKSTMCKICGARLRPADKRCPNEDRADHKEKSHD